jgi:hypothetical protein
MSLNFLCDVVPWSQTYEGNRTSHRLHLCKLQFDLVNNTSSTFFKEKKKRA